ncbi:MAG: hypothetical protein EPN33_11125 [Acidobacteria bacterium]|nr:MAG: hypothetical protein EPN33_11125 [Acidobacteriota bacterium]
MSTQTFVVPAHIAELRGTAPRHMYVTLWILLGIGVLAFLWLLFTNPQALWLSYLGDFIFFTGIAQACVVWSAVTRGCNARWARPLQRIAEGMAAPLILSAVLFIPLLFEHRVLYTWWDHPVKLPWLNHTWLLTRDIGIFVFLAWLSWYFFLVSTRADRRNDYEALTAKGSADAKRAQRQLSRLWVLLAFCFCYLYGVLGMDLNVSLYIGWYNYIYPWFFFISSWYAGCAMMELLAVLWRRRFGLKEIIDAGVLHDTGLIAFAFAIFWGYQFWAQYMALWYANRQDDIHILIRLSQQHPWVTLSWVTLTLAFFLPFGFGLSRSYKRRPATLAYIACLSLGGMWLQQNLMVDVSVWQHGFPPLISSAFLSCGFAGAYGLCYLWAMKRVPLFPVRDPVMHEALVWHPVRH